MKNISSLIVLLTASFVSAGLTHAAEDVSPIPTVSEAWFSSCRDIQMLIFKKDSPWVPMVDSC
jgi:hypothetical protein